jgi:hypothetical protein
MYRSNMRRILQDGSIWFCWDESTELGTPLEKKNLDINIGDVPRYITDVKRHNTISDTLIPEMHNVPY